MNLHSDVIQNKNYTYPICAELQKHSQEYRVLATLRYLLPQQYAMMTAGESPDLQDKKNSIGIEVTAAVRENDMKVSRIFSGLCQENDAQKAEKRIKKIESCGYSLVPIYGEKISVIASGTSNEEKVFLQESVRKKKQKFEQYRSKFRTLGLAIVLPEIPTTEAEDCCIAWIYEEFQKDQNSIDFAYVLSHRFCIYYDVRMVRYEKWTISNEDNCSLCTIARMTAEGELSLNDQEWN